MSVIIEGIIATIDAANKLIKVINGSIFDVFVDLREDSNDFGAYSSIELTQDMGWVLIPKGFAHGFKTLEDNTSVLYKVDQYYNEIQGDHVIKPGFL